MLSRVAENIFWLARYLERAENTARLAVATTHALLDAPLTLRRNNSTMGQADFRFSVGHGVDWPSLVIVTGGHEIFSRSGKVACEETVMDFMTRSKENPSSILSSLSLARENLRTTRDVFPRKAMEYLNAMYLGFKEQMSDDFTDEGKLYKALDQVIQDSQKVSGLLFSTMSRDSAFEFFRLGQILERADMTTRILDVGAVGIKDISKDPLMMPFVNSLWLNILRALSGEQMYRRHINPRIHLNQVAKFLLQDEQFPRSVTCCLSAALFSLTRLVNHDAACNVLGHMKSTLQGADVIELLKENRLPAFLDQLQIGLGQLCEEIRQTYFPELQE